MKFYKIKTSGYDIPREEIELNSLEDLAEFIDNANEEVIIYRDRHFVNGNYELEDMFTLEIYDTWRE